VALRPPTHNVQIRGSDGALVPSSASEPDAPVDNATRRSLGGSRIRRAARRQARRFLHAFLLYQAGGWAAVNRAYRDPPTSTEQILHPDRYLVRRDRPQKVTVPDVSGRLGAGWGRGTEIGFGELDVRLLLHTKLPQSTAEAAAAGWDGGRLRTFERAGRTFVGIVLREAVVIEFAAAHAAVTPASTVAPPGRAKW